MYVALKGWLMQSFLNTIFPFLNVAHASIIFSSREQITFQFLKFLLTATKESRILTVK